MIKTGGSLPPLRIIEGGAGNVYGESSSSPAVIPDTGAQKSEIVRLAGRGLGDLVRGIRDDMRAAASFEIGPPPGVEEKTPPLLAQLANQLDGVAHQMENGGINTVSS
ncbi:MAG: hypothetical protein HYS22_08380 [Deltaproteobacteria bacterium]|nr:hypothetical protein [Deltaproteobacteria bacterium]